MNKDAGLFIVCLIIGGLIPMTLLGVDFYMKDVQEVQLYDTYYVFNPIQFIAVPVGLTLFLSFLIRGILTKFRNRLTWIFFSFGTLIIGLVGIEIFEILNGL